MSKRTKLKFKNINIFIKKYILGGGYFVRNTLVLMTIASLVGVIAFISASTKDEEKPKEVKQEVVEQALNITAAEQMSVAPLDNLLLAFEASGETGIEANEPNMVLGAEDEFDTKFVAIESDINIRKEATVDSDIVGKLNEGNVGEVISSDGEWLNISSGLVSGYVKAEFVVTGQAAKDIADEYKTLTLTVTGDSVRVRSAASTDGEVITTVYNGEKYIVDADTTNTLTGWVCMLLDGSTKGYISDEFVSVEEGYTAATMLEVPKTDETENEQDEINGDEQGIQSNNEIGNDETQEAPAQEAPAQVADNTPSTESEAPVTEAPATEAPTTEAPTTDDSSNSNEVTVGTVNRGSISLSEEDIMLMACVISLEAGSESYEGKLAVANVIINRLQSGAWGSTVYDVVYAPSQFTVTTSPQMQALVDGGAPSSCVQVARDAAAGTNNIGSYMSFRPLYNANTDSYSIYTIIGNHCFF